MKKAAIIIIACVALAGAIVLLAGRHGPVPTGEVGVVTGPGGAFKIYTEGDSPFAVPVLQRLHLISTDPATVLFIDESAFKRTGPDGKEVLIESQVNYSLAQVSAAVGEFGAEALHDKVMQRIRAELAAALDENVQDPAVLTETSQRIIQTAQMHMALSSTFSAYGVNINTFQIRLK